MKNITASAQVPLDYSWRADRSAFYLPQSITQTKDDKSRVTNVRPVAIIEYRITNKQKPWQMTEKHETGTNDVVEVIYLIINERTNFGQL